MGPYRFDTLRRLLECEAQFLLFDHDMDTPETELARAGHQAIAQYLHLRDSGLVPDGQQAMDALATRVLLADARQTKALREALYGLESWFPIPVPDPEESTLIEEPVYVVLTTVPAKVGGRMITGSRIATPDERSAGRVEGGWLCREILDYAILPPLKGIGGQKSATVIDWKFDRALPEHDAWLRELEVRFHALLAWIRHGTLCSRVRVTTVYPMLQVAKVRTFDRDNFLDTLNDLEGLLIRADQVLASGPATVEHARVGARCVTCSVSHVCPAADAAVLSARPGAPEWAGHAERWILLRRRVKDLEASLREKTRADGPIATSNGYEVGFSRERPADFGVFRQRFEDDLPVVDPT